MEKFLQLEVPIESGIVSGPIPRTADDIAYAVGTTTTGGAAFQLLNTASIFTTNGVAVGDYAVNVDTGDYALVLVVGADNAALDLDKDIFAANTAGINYRVMDSATALTLTTTSGNFDGNVSVGDVILNGYNREATVTGVTDDNNLTLDAPLFSTESNAAEQVFYIYVDPAGVSNSQLLNISNIAGVYYGSGTTVVVDYKERRVDGSLNKVTITSVLANNISLELLEDLQEGVVSSYEQSWTRVVKPLRTNVRISSVAVS